MLLSEPVLTEREGEELEELLEYLKKTRGFDFRAYKRSTLTRRIRKRMGVIGVDSFAQYRAYLEEEPAEFVPLFNTFLINVTQFFRDGEPWAYLEREVIPRLLEEKRRFDPIRVWSAGCASGEEAFTIAMLLAESMGLDEFKTRVKIYATDVDEQTLNGARHATFEPRLIENIPPELLEKYFERTNGNYAFRKDIRRCVIFGRHDLLQDAPYRASTFSSAAIR